MGGLKDRTLAELTVDSGERPRAPALDGVTEAHRRQGRHLAAIHRMHLMDLARIGNFLELVEAGTEAPEKLAAAVGTLDMTRNYRMFGNLCGRECMALTFHHNAEENGIFPQVEASGVPGLRALVARLREEHEVVHELLERLEAAAIVLVDDATPETFEAARAVFRQLVGVVKSHFGYEETELREALGKYVPYL